MADRVGKSFSRLVLDNVGISWAAVGAGGARGLIESPLSRRACWGRRRCAVLRQALSGVCMWQIPSAICFRFLNVKEPRAHDSRISCPSTRSAFPGTHQLAGRPSGFSDLAVPSVSGNPAAEREHPTKQLGLTGPLIGKPSVSAPPHRRVGESAFSAEPVWQACGNHRLDEWANREQWSSGWGCEKLCGVLNGHSMVLHR
jgi:hypothetical protein